MDDIQRRVDAVRRSRTELENGVIDELFAGRISRREFVRAGSVLGMSLLIVEQNVHAVLALAQRAYILESGRIIGAGEGRKLLDDDHVRAAYLGPLARGDGGGAGKRNLDAPKGLSGRRVTQRAGKALYRDATADHRENSSRESDERS